MFFKLTFVRTKYFQKIVENRKTRCLSFSSIFLRGLFYWMKLYFKFLTILVYALVGVSSLLLLVLKINQWRKLREVISFTYTLQHGIEGVLIIFGGGQWIWKNSLKLINGGWGVAIKGKHTIFCLQRSVHLQYISSSRGEQNGCWRRGKTKKLMRYSDSTNKVQ